MEGRAGALSQIPHLMLAPGAQPPSLQCMGYLRQSWRKPVISACPGGQGSADQSGHGLHPFLRREARPLTDGGAEKVRSGLDGQRS